MCGIVGIMSRSNVVERLVEGLKRLEYRGYDSAGVAITENNFIDRRRAAGKIINLEAELVKNPLKGCRGIGHTRWATHGEAHAHNAHPHSSDHVSIVHNGIIENFADLKKDLEQKGHIFQSETDTEVVVHQITDLLVKNNNPLLAVQETLKKLHGAFSLVIIFKEYDDLMICTRSGSPLVLGYGKDDVYVGSDALALAAWTQDLVYLKEKDLAVIKDEGAAFSVTIYDELGTVVDRPHHQSRINIDAVSKGAYNHYMLKEIYEQPSVLGETFNSLVENSTHVPHVIRDTLTQLPLKDMNRIAIIACGTSYYAGMTAKYWLESYAKISVDVDIASEFRYRDPLVGQYDLVIFISQSGETIDTLSALRLVKEQGVKVASILNMPESSMARESDYVIQTQAGPEIGVASTKAFTCQLLTLAMITLQAAYTKGHLSTKKLEEELNTLLHLPSKILNVLNHDEAIQEISKHFVESRDVLYLGRGTNYPIALEGALKLKELSYIHAEAYPAGELKHGPIALIDHLLPVVVLAPYDKWFEKTLSNVQEVIARGAYVVAITDKKGAALFKNQGMKNTHIIEIPEENHTLLSPIIYSIPMQLLSYYTAYFKGTDVDQPRNLAKSVTVE